MSGRRRTHREASEESYSNSSDDENNGSTAKRQKSNNSDTTASGFTPGKDDLAYKMAVATARVMIGLSSRNQVLNKTTIAKILDAENEKGSGLQFKKFVLPVLSMLIADVFHYDVVELPSKKSTQAQSGNNSNTTGSGNSNQTQQDPSSTQHSKATPSDEFILVNRLPPSLRALNYTFMAEHTQPIGKSMKAMDRSKQGFPSTNIYGEDLPRPTSAIVQNGITLLIICIVLLHGNNILQSDLILILRTKFGLKFKEKEVVSILGDQTLTDFLAMLGRQDYLDRTLITATGANAGSTMAQRTVNSRSVRHDDNTLILRLGRRCRAEWSADEFVGLFRQLMQDSWTEQLQESAVYTVHSVWTQ